ncbi:Bacitracin transport permease protein BCRB [Bacillus amyloliquefaciens]|nr:Bacitracin transport permease protein BCRB [Bacillus amyloliquefaciens]
MLKLMKLEYKKHHLSQYFKWVALWIFIIFALAAFMGWESKNENELMFRDYADFISLTNILIRIVFISFSAVILSRLVIDEYKNKTIQLLFTYPLQRKKLMQAKLSIVFLFCFVSIVIATFVINLLILFVSPHLYLFEKPVEMSEVISAMPSTLLTAFMMGGVSLIPLFFGMRKKFNFCYNHLGCHNRGLYQCNSFRRRRNSQFKSIYYHSNYTLFIWFFSGLSFLP